jgi:autotransporter-associated beta strand protein
MNNDAQRDSTSDRLTRAKIHSARVFHETYISPQFKMKQNAIFSKCHPQLALRLSPGFALCLLLTLLAQPGYSATYVWTNLVAGSASGSWTTTTAWSPNGTPISGDIADLSMLDITANSTLSLGGNQTNASLIFGDVVASSDWIVDNSGSLTLESATVAPAISVTNRTATIQAVIAGTNGFTKLGAGALVLSGANTYSGVTTQSLGTLTIAVGGAGTGDAPTSGPFGISTISLEGGTLNTATGAGLVYNSISVPTGKTIAMGTTVAGAALSLAGSISGGGTINESGNQTAGTHLSGTNSGFTGTFNSTGNGSHRVRFDNANSGSAAAIWLLDNSNTDGEGLAFGDGTISFGTLTGNGQIRNDNGGTGLGLTVVRVGDLNASSTFTGNFANVNTMSLLKVGTGTLIFSGANQYRGSTTISNGVLQLGAGGGSGTINNDGFTSATVDTTIYNYSKLGFSYNRADTFGFNPQRHTGPGSLSFTNIGTGIMTLRGTNDYQGDTTIAAGAIRLLNPFALPGGPGVGNLILNGTLDVNSNSIVLNGLSGSGIVDNMNTNGGVQNLTIGSNDVSSVFSGPIKNSAAPTNGSALAVTKVGAGTITISGANTYNGPTTINGGELDINTSKSGGGAITASVGTKLGVLVNSAISIPAAILTASNTSVLSFSGLNSTTVAPINATNLAPDGTVTINAAGSFVAGSQYPLIKFTSYTGAGGFALGTLPVATTATLVTNGSAIKLNVTAAAPLVWKGNLSTNWDIATTANWTLNAVASTYVDGQTVQFNNTATTGNVNLSTTVSPGGVLVTNTSLSYVFTSASGSGIGGSGGLTKLGSSTLTLSGLTNTYSGLTTIGGGAVVIDRDQNIGAPTPGDITLNGGTLSAASSLTLSANRIVAIGPASGSGSGTMDVAASQTLTFGGVIANNVSGTGSLTKTGNGILALSGANTYSGSTLVSGGKLSVTAAQQIGGAITVNNGTTLTVSRTGGTTLPTASLTLGTGGATTLELANLSSSSAVITATNLTTSGTVTVSVLTGVPALGEVPLIKYNGSIGGSGFGAISLAPLPPGVTAILTNDTANKIVGLLVANVAALTWTGTNGTTWDIGITTNWSYLGANVAFQAGSGVILDDAAFTNILNLNSTASVFNMLVTNNTLNYTLSGNGSLSGPMTLTKTGTGTFTMANLGSDSYTGGTILQQGILDARNSAALGSGTITLAGGTLENNSASGVILANGVTAQASTTSTIQTTGTADQQINISGNITGSGNIVANNSGGGIGGIVLNGDNSAFTGTLTVNNNSSMRFWFAAPTAGSASAQWVLNSAGTDNQKFTFGTGTISFGSLSGGGQLRNDGGASTVTLMVGDLNLDSTFTGAIVANGAANFALTKVGAGTFTLAGNQTFSGLTEVANGTLLISTAQTATKNYVVDDGATLGFNNIGGQAALASLTVGASLGASLLFTNVSDTGTAPAYVSGAGGLTNNGICTIKLADTNNLVAGNIYPLVQYSAYTGSGSFVLSAPPGLPMAVVNDTALSQILLVVPASTAPTNLTAVASGGNLALSWPDDHRGWLLQTNSVGVAAANAWFYYPGSASVTSVNIPIDPAQTNVFFRLVLP